MYSYACSNTLGITHCLSIVWENVMYALCTLGDYFGCVRGKNAAVTQL